jgi:hypothetical protein
MPASSEAQRELFAIAEHHPEKLHKENKGLLKLSHKQLHDFASTKGLSVRHPGALKKASRK